MKIRILLITLLLLVHFVYIEIFNQSKYEPIMKACYVNKYAKLDTSHEMYEVDKVIRISDKEVEFTYTFPNQTAFKNNWYVNDFGNTLNIYSISRFKEQYTKVNCPY